MAMGLCLEIGAIIHDAKPLTYQSASECSLSNVMITGLPYGLQGREEQIDSET